jgi:curved DNA-binding protein CbpA
MRIRRGGPRPYDADGALFVGHLRWLRSLGILVFMSPRARFDKDYYATLGLATEATEEEIRKAYRRLALQWHPDRNAGDSRAAERFKGISEAYAVLIDSGKRREYDRARQVGAPGAFRHKREDIFRDLFADPRASDVFEELVREFERIGVRVDRHVFQQTLFGGRTVVAGGVFVATPFTSAVGLLRLMRAAMRGAQVRLEEHERRAPSPPRGLLGRVADTGRWLLGLPQAALNPRPSGRDLTVQLRLTRSEAQRGGRKRLTVEREDGRDELLVTIPSGIRPGTRLRLRGKGRRAPDGPPGDLYLAVELSD